MKTALKTNRAQTASEQAHLYLVFPKSVDRNDYTVLKLDGSADYTVDLDQRTCTCPDRAECCKHYYMARKHAIQNPETLLPVL
jgi:hypothetical protein